MELPTRGQLRAGEPAAFGLLFDAYAGAVYQHAVRRTGDRGAAEEAVSLTFLEAWRLRERLLPEGGSCLPWLLGIATNVLRNLSRAARRHREALQRLPPRPSVPDFADDLVARMHDASRLAAARRALAKLRSAERDVFMLCVWSGLDYAAAAEALGVPVGTVRSRLSRSREKLRKLLDADLEPGSGDGQIQGDRIPSLKEPRR
ncbi:RNA polymerase sigma factor [Dactylosporangium siamense]|uniref:Siderophore-interacting protein n=1 Tax=Dactylosporangium siamense TaxID=685454 RepID=A0A919PR52_9ACTN|nr:RNA polymerase sigma factor [Dactylosporangium siamense]GIG46803.1 siderophore-interacting protein [Dactylosporangium siamense]